MIALSRRLIAICAIALGATCFVAFAGLLSPLRDVEDRTIDWRFLFRGPRGERASEIILVLIEEEANLAYRSPIPRKHLAQIIERVSNAKLIGLDIFLDKPSFDREGDARLRQGIEQSRKVIGVSFIDKDEGQEHIPGSYFRDAMLDVGYATFAIDSDREVVRRGTVTWDLEGGRALSLAGCLFAHYVEVDTERLRSTTGVVEGIPVGRSILINFSGPPNQTVRRAKKEMPGGFIVCPSHLVVSGIYPDAFFKDKIILIGSALMDAPDRFRTPFFARSFGHQKMYGVEIHAHLLQTMLSGVHLHPLHQGLTFLLVFVLSALLAGVVLRTDSLKGAGLLIVLLVIWWSIGFAVFGRYNRVMPVVLPSLGLLFSYGSTTAYYALTEGREKRRIRQLFEKYLSPEVIRELLQDPSSWDLGGKNMDITVMFADLEGFTPLSEKLDPEDLVLHLYEHFTAMSAAILEHRGTIVTYEGDLIMAVFGAPLPQDDHAINACRAALHMQEDLEKLRQNWRAQRRPELHMRIGLHSGTAVVGNMGSEFRFNYTATGDMVNLASRLEGANKQFGTYTLISGATRTQAGTTFHYRNLGEIQVKGKSKPTEVYELLSAEDTAVHDA